MDSVVVIDPDGNHELVSKVSSEDELETESVSIIEACVHIKSPAVSVMLIKIKKRTTVMLSFQFHNRATEP